MYEELIAIIAILTPVLIVGIVFYFKYQSNQLVHRERMAMIEKGLMPADIKPEQMAEVAETLHPYRRQHSLSSSIVTTLIGLALLLGLSTMGWGPWLLAGLIPMAVGLGQLIALVASVPKEDGGKKGGE